MDRPTTAEGLDYVKCATHGPTGNVDELFGDTQRTHTPSAHKYLWRSDATLEYMWHLAWIGVFSFSTRTKAPKCDQTK